MIHMGRCACEINHGTHQTVFCDFTVLPWRHELPEMSEEGVTRLLVMQVHSVIKNRPCSNMNAV